jgi:benzoyl-CoA 2,3-dioxygenase component B
VQRWNRLVAAARNDFRFQLPSIRFHRSIGVCAAVATDLEGRSITDEESRRRKRDWLPPSEDRGFVASLMQPVTAPGKVAGWIAPPEIGINNVPLDSSTSGSTDSPYGPNCHERSC